MLREEQINWGKTGVRLYFQDKTIFIPYGDMKEIKRERDSAVFEAEAEHCRVVWSFRAFGEGALVDMSVSSELPMGLRRMDSLVFEVGSCKETDRIAFFGGDIYNCENRFPSELGVDREYFADCAGWFADLSQRGTAVAGIIPFNNLFGACVCKKENGSLEFAAKTEFTESVLQERELHAEQVLFLEKVTVNDLYDTYQRLLPQSSFAMPKLTGWNSWDYYLDKVCPEDIFENVKALKNADFCEQLEYIVIDDGWQESWGDWQENDKFSCGLRHVADVISEAGFTPGIWMAPLAVREDSSVFKDHKDWLLRTDDGTLFRDFQYYIDPTNPEAESFILNNYRYQYAAGYRLFKIDYLSPILKIRDFYDKSVTGYAALRGLIQKIQAATGEDAVILGCSLPVQCGADVAPSMRIAVDIHNHFSHVEWIAEALSWKWMYNDRVTRIDPDFLIVRGAETSLEPLVWEGGYNDFVAPPRAEETDDDYMKRRWRHGDQFNAIEAETWANLVAISGGNLFLSDRISVLNETGLAIIRKALKISGDTARPYFLPDDQRRPSVWKNEKYMLVINWEDEERELCVTLEQQVRIKLRPHESRLFDRL